MSRGELKDIFLELCDLPPEQRAAGIEQRCGGDAELKSLVQSLLDAHDLDAQHSIGPTLTGIDAHLPMPRPQHVGPYRILEEIGEGGFGTVYLAEQVHPVRRRVALKVIKLGMDTRQVIARFEAERQALAIMDHPAIARVFDAGATETGRPYFVMELVQGVPITHYCDEQRMPIAQRLELFAQVCLAVQHAHQKGVIHRDIKPSNVLVSTVDGRPQAKVIDFGVAKATQARLTEKTVFTESQQLVGTPEYMSPEQAEGSLDIDTRSDVYSLGVLLYELLVGSPPFDSRELRSKAYAEMQRIIREVDPPRPSTRLTRMSDRLPSVAAQRAIEPRRLNAAVRGDLDWIVMKALEKNRARRYESSAALAADITRHLAHEPVSAGPPSRLYRARKFIRRQRAAVVSAAIILLLLIGGITGTTLGLLEARTQRDEARRQQQQAEEHYAQAMAVSRFQADMLASADPSKLLGDKVTVLQAVTAAINELDAGKLTDQPLVEANVRTVIGNTLRALGRYDLAAPSFQRALELRRSALAPDNPLLAPTLRNLARNLQEQGQLRQAEARFRESLEIYRKAGPAEESAVPNALAHVAETLKLQGKFAEAEELAREALNLQRQLHPVPDETTDGMATNLGLVLRAQKKFDEAEVLLREALELRRKRLPADHPDLAKAIGNLAGLLEDQQKHDESEALYREVLRIQQKTLPARHPDLARTQFNLGWNLMNREKPAEAEPLFREATANFAQALGTEHWMTATGHRSIGAALLEQKRYSEAETELLDAERVLAAAQNSDRHIRCLRALVTLYEAWDRSDPGSGYATKAAQWRSRLPATQPATAAAATR